MFPGETLSFSFTSVLTDAQPLHPGPAGTVSPGRAGNRNSPLRTSWVLRVQPDSSHPPTRQGRTLSSAPFTGGVAGRGGGLQGAAVRSPWRQEAVRTGGGTSGPPRVDWRLSAGCWANPASALGSEVGVQEGRPLLEWPGCPGGGGDAAHRKSGCRPPLPPPQTCGCPPAPLATPPHTRTHLLAAHPSSILTSAPAPTLFVFAPVQRGSELQSQGLSVWGSSAISLSPPSLHTQSGVCISGL